MTEPSLSGRACDERCAEPADIRTCHASSSLAAELIVGRSRDILYTPPKGSVMFPCEEANDPSCMEGAEPRRAGSARDAGALVRSPVSGPTAAGFFFAK